MTSKEPPKIATWMLKHFGSDLNNDAILGDLAERYREKGSAMWYWRQAMSGIAVSLFREIRGHKWIAARSLVMGWFMWILYVTLIFPLLTPLFSGSHFAVAIVPQDPIGTAWSVLWAPVLGQANFGTSFSFAFAVGLPLVVWTICGWLVARFHRDHETSMVLLLAGSMLLIDLLLAGPFILRVGPFVASQHLFGPLAANISASVLGVLFGGKLRHAKAV